jgi:hypothetical protein
VNIEYSIHRYGEWTMLMLGEGVLQLIVVPVYPSDVFYGTFILGYILMALLELLHYATGPNHPEGHCMRRSARRVFVWVILESFYSAALVCVGVGLKLVLKYSAADIEKAQQYRSLLACACSAAILLVWGCRLCHAGFDEEFLLATGKMKLAKLMIWLVKFSLAGACFGLAFVHVNNWVVELGCAVCVFLSFGIQVYDSRRFGDSLRVRRARPQRTVSDIEKESGGATGAAVQDGDETAGSFATSISSYTGIDDGDDPVGVGDNDTYEAVIDETNPVRFSSPGSGKFDFEVGGVVQNENGDDDNDSDDILATERSRCELLRQHAWSTRDVMVCDGMGLPQHSSWVDVDLDMVDKQIKNYETQIKELKRLRRRNGAPVSP